MKRGIAEFRQHNSSFPIYYGYIIVPDDVDRTDFIERCYRRERVTILVERGGGVVNDCYIDKNVLQHIEFPEDKGKVGTPVVYLSIPSLNLPIIIAAISAENDTQLLSKNKFEFKKSNGSQTATLTVNGEVGSVNITGAGGGVKIKSSKDEILLKSLEGGINIESDEIINMAATANLNITSQNDDQTKQTAISLTEDSFTINDLTNSVSSTGEQIDIVPKTKLNLFAGSEPLVLGSKNSDILNSIQSILSNLNLALTTFATTQLGVCTSPPLNALAGGFSALVSTITTQVSAINELIMKIQQNNSSKSFTD